jgi:CMP-N-acetylneuraminic acid synthetase
VSHGQRQNNESYYKVNGAMFLAHASTLRDYGTFHIDLCIPMVMPMERSIDINHQNDLFLADKLLRLKQDEQST